LLFFVPAAARAAFFFLGGGVPSSSRMSVQPANASQLTPKPCPGLLAAPGRRS
jgi:hypothetical protein